MAHFCIAKGGGSNVVSRRINIDQIFRFSIQKLVNMLEKCLINILILLFVMSYMHKLSKMNENKDTNLFNVPPWDVKE